MTPTVRYDPPYDWFFGDHRRSSDGAYYIIIKRNDLSTATATDLARALRKARRHEDEPEAVAIDLARDDEYWPKNTVVDPSNSPCSTTAALPFDARSPAPITSTTMDSSAPRSRHSSSLYCDVSRPTWRAYRLTLTAPPLPTSMKPSSQPPPAIRPWTSSTKSPRVLPRSSTLPPQAS